RPVASRRVYPRGKSAGVNPPPSPTSPPPSFFVPQIFFGPPLGERPFPSPPRPVWPGGPNRDSRTAGAQTRGGARTPPYLPSPTPLSRLPTPWRPTPASSPPTFPRRLAYFDSPCGSFG